MGAFNWSSQHLDLEVWEWGDGRVGRRRRQVRRGMRAPGRPPVAGRKHRHRFRDAIARGLASEDTGVDAGVSPTVGTR
ncbi:hypothetical protein UK82_20130 [Frankia sp. ACN1ag]|nr:hypothetical protein UK82_20130 [Frankia sp. ACN1ag]